MVVPNLKMISVRFKNTFTNMINFLIGDKFLIGEYFQTDSKAHDLYPCTRNVKILHLLSITLRKF